MKHFYTLDTGRILYNINPEHIQSVEVEGIAGADTSAFKPWIRIKVRVTSGETTGISLEESREKFDRGLKFLLQLHRDGYFSNDNLAQTLKKIKDFFVVQAENRIYELERLEEAEMENLSELIEESSIEDVSTLIEEVVALQKMTEEA